MEFGRHGEGWSKNMPCYLMGIVGMQHFRVSPTLWTKSQDILTSAASILSSTFFVSSPPHVIAILNGWNTPLNWFNLIQYFGEFTLFQSYGMTLRQQKMTTACLINKYPLIFLDICGVPHCVDQWLACDSERV